MLIKTRRLGLAAYIKMCGAKLVKVDKVSYWFESDKTEQEWSVAYSNSCCHQHDTELVNLRKLRV